MASSQSPGWLVNGVDVLAVREQLLLLGHNVADDMIVSFLKGLNLDGCLDALDTDPAHDLAVDYPQQAGAPHYEAQQAAGSDGDDLGSPSEDDRGGRAAGQALRKCQPVAQQEVHVSHAQGPRLQPLKAGVNMLLPGSSSGRFAGMLGALAAAPGMPGDRPDVSPLRDCAQDQSSPAGKPLAKPYASDATASRLDDLAACGSDDGDDDAEEPLGLDMRCRSFLSRLAERRSAHGGGEALPPSAHDADFTDGSADGYDSGDESDGSSSGYGSEALNPRAAARGLGLAAHAAAPPRGTVATLLHAQRGAPARRPASPGTASGASSDVDTGGCSAYSAPGGEAAVAEAQAANDVIIRDLSQGALHDLSQRTARGQARYDSNSEWHAPELTHPAPQVPGGQHAHLLAEDPALADLLPAAHALSLQRQGYGGSGLRAEANMQQHQSHSIMEDVAAAVPRAVGSQGGVRRLPADPVDAHDPLYHVPLSPSGASPAASMGRSPRASLGVQPPPGRRAGAAAGFSTTSSRAPSRASSGGSRGGPAPWAPAGVAGRRLLYGSGSGQSRQQQAHAAAAAAAGPRPAAAPGPQLRKVDRVARYQQLQQQWSKDSFLRSGGGGATQPRRPQNFHSHYAALHAAAGAGQPSSGSMAGGAHTAGQRGSSVRASRQQYQ